MMQKLRRLKEDYMRKKVDLDNTKINVEAEKDITNLHDNVNHPEHYQTPTGLETIDVIEAFTYDLTGIEAVCTGNALKYLCRWKHKNGIEDLKKAVWYINKLIDKSNTEND